MAHSTIYLHRDFDGVASAALVLRGLREEFSVGKTALKTVDYGEPWSETTLSKPCAVVDFLYPRDATYFWDHHASAYPSRIAESHFRERSNSGDTVWFDPDEPSCALLIARTLDELAVNEEVRDIVAWAKVIDGARYRSVKQVFASEEPALQINLSLAEAPEDFYTRVTRLLAAGSPDAAAQSQGVQSRFARAKEAQQVELDYFGPRLRDEGGVASGDMSDQVLRFSRYAPYCFSPDALYSVVLYREPSRLKLLCMRNPWLDFESVDLGALCRLYGGGHRRVGAVAFPLHEETPAGAVLKEVRTAVLQHAATAREMISAPV